MTITYTEFDTTPANIISTLKSNILANTHWSDQGVTAVTTTNTIATTAAGNTATLTSVSGFTVGQWIIVNPGASEVYRQITAVAGSVITITGTWGSIYAIGTSFKTRNTVLKSTADSGATLMIDLEGGDLSTSFNSLGLAVYRAYTGTSPGGWTDAKGYSIFWKQAAGVSTMPIHVTLSVGKNHLFIAIEGPRAWETSPTSTTAGSVKNYFALSDLVAYHAGDTIPAVIAIGNTVVTPSVTNGSHQVSISRDTTDTASWTAGRVGSLDWPTMYTTDVVTMNRGCTIDGKTYLLPYVMFSEAEGIRGRLSSFFYAGTTAPSPATDYADPVGSKVTYGSIVYKLLPVNKGDGSNVAWGPFGSIANNSTVTRSIVVAVPFSG